MALVILLNPIPVDSPGVEIRITTRTPSGHFTCRTMLSLMMISTVFSILGRLFYATRGVPTPAAVPMSRTLTPTPGASPGPAQRFCRTALKAVVHSVSVGVLDLRPIPPLVKAFQQGISAAILPVKGLMQVYLNPMDSDGGVRELEPTVADEFVQPLLVIDGQVKARALAKKLLLEVPLVLILDEAARASPFVHGDIVHHRPHPSVIVVGRGIGEGLEGFRE